MLGATSPPPSPMFRSGTLSPDNSTTSHAPFTLLMLHDASTFTWGATLPPPSTVWLSGALSLSQHAEICTVFSHAPCSCSGRGREWASLELLAISAAVLRHFSVATMLVYRCSMIRTWAARGSCEMPHPFHALRHLNNVLHEHQRYCVYWNSRCRCRADWKKCAVSPEEEKARTERFKAAFKVHDIMQ